MGTGNASRPLLIGRMCPKQGTRVEFRRGVWRGTWGGALLLAVPVGRRGGCSSPTSSSCCVCVLCFQAALCVCLCWCEIPGSRCAACVHQHCLPVLGGTAGVILLAAPAPLPCSLLHAPFPRLTALRGSVLLSLVAMVESCHVSLPEAGQQPLHGEREPSCLQASTSPLLSRVRYPLAPSLQNCSRECRNLPVGGVVCGHPQMNSVANEYK